MRLSVGTFCVAAFAVSAIVPAAHADTSQVVKSWRTADGWLTELRRHSNGANVCVSAKAFTTPHQFGLSIIRSGPATLVTLVDQQQPPTSAGDLTISSGNTQLGSFQTTVQGPAWATTEADSQKMWSLLSDVTPGAVALSVAGRQYDADLAGIAEARAQLQTCRAESGQ